MINRILIVGFGSIGKKHLSIARRLFPDAQIMVLRHKKSPADIEHANFVSNSEKEAIDFSPQISVICNPSSHHLSIATILATAGSNLLIEKPISNETKGVLKLIKFCKANKKVIHIGYNLRYRKSLLFFKNEIDNKCIGKILSVRSEVGQYLPSWRADSDYRSSVSAKKSLGGGVLLELSHELDYLRWIFGEITWVRSTTAKLSSLDIDVEDYANLTLGIERPGDHNCIIANLTLDFFRHDDYRTCYAIGENGTLKWDGIKDTVQKRTYKEKNWTMLYEGSRDLEESYVNEWREFVQQIFGSETNIVSGMDGLAVLEVIDSARKSSKNGQQVNVRKPTKISIADK